MNEIVPIFGPGGKRHTAAVVQNADTGIDFSDFLNRYLLVYADQPILIAQVPLPTGFAPEVKFEIDPAFSGSIAPVLAVPGAGKQKVMFRRVPKETYVPFFVTKDLAALIMRASTATPTGVVEFPVASRSNLISVG